MLKTRDELTAVSRGYWTARALLSAVELGLFEALGARRLGPAALARQLKVDARALELLLDALVGQGVLGKSKTSYEIPLALRPFLGRGPASALGMLRHHAALWRTWSNLTESVRTGSSLPSDSSFRRGPEEARAFTVAMRDGARRLAPEVATEVNLRGRRRMLDLGGGPGVYAVEFARANPRLDVVVVELPLVAAVGEEMCAEHKDVHDRISWVAADIEKDPLPDGADCAFLSHVIHGNDEQANRDLFAKVAGALGAGGLFIVRDFFLNPDRTMPAAASLFSLNMLVNTPAGRSYSAKETMAWLRDAGFATATFRRSRAVPGADYVLARTAR
jgi:ubiquinone/menaquinone biosynthesis C-methylase UbiE